MLFMLLGRTVIRVIREGLDAKAAQIHEDIQAAARMRDEAQEMLNESRRKQIEAIEQANQILNHAKNESTRLKLKAVNELEEFRDNEARLLTQRIERAEQEMLKEVRNRAIDVAVMAVKNVVSKNLTTEEQLHLISESISDLDDYEITDAQKH